MIFWNVVSRWAQLVNCICRMLNITDSDLQIQNYKNEVQLKLKLHQLWRIALWLSKLQLSVFLKGSVSLLTVARSSSLGNSFWISLTVFGLFCYCHFVIRQDHGFGSAHEPHQLPGWLCTQLLLQEQLQLFSSRGENGTAVLSTELWPWH